MGDVTQIFNKTQDGDHHSNQHEKKRSTSLKTIMMKKLSLFSVVFLSSLVTVLAQSTPVIRITGTRLVYPLFQRWVDEYTKLHPGIKFIISKSPADSADLLIVSHKLGQGDIKNGQTTLVVTRYVQLPVVNSRRGDVAALQSKGFDDSAFRRVYFSDKDDKGHSIYQFTVYKRQQPACASIAFANHFDNEQKDIKGVGVAGDDRDLLTAVKRDPSGISYNNLGFLYDLRSRKLIDSISIIPIDLNGNGRIDPDEDIYGSLDDVIGFVEKTHHPRIPLENVNVLYRKDGPVKDIAPFLQWVLTKGQQY